MPELDVDQLLGADDFATLSVGPLEGSMQTYPYTGLSEAGAAAIILANLGHVRTPIDVTVDGSSDGGATWTELASASGVIRSETLLVDAPPDVIRVTLVGEADSVEVRLRPFRSTTGGAPVAVYASKLTLTDAQFKALPTSPIVVVPAPDEAQVLLPISAILVLDNTAGGYGNLGDTQVLLGLSWGADFIIPDGILQTTLENYADHDQGAIGGSFGLGPHVLGPLGPVNPAWIAEAGQIRGQAVSTYIANRSAGGYVGDLTDGDPANSLHVTVLYTVVDLD